MAMLEIAYKRPSVQNTLNYLGVANDIGYNWWKRHASKNAFLVGAASDLPFAGTWIRANEFAERARDYETATGISYADARYPVSALYNLGYAGFDASARSSFHAARNYYKRRKASRKSRRRRRLRRF